MPEDPTRVYFSFFNEVGIIAQLSRAMFEARMPEGMLLPHFSVLNHLIRVGDGATPLKLARAFQVPKTSMTHTLAGLEDRALIRMAPNPKDARSKCVWITDAGRVFRDKAIASLAPDIERLAKAFPAGNLEAMLPSLEAMRKTLDEDRSA
ncbi:MAG: MarR family transcriptional regulator [Pseudomonadota bacterium]